MTTRGMFWTDSYCSKPEVHEQAIIDAKGRMIIAVLNSDYLKPAVYDAAAPGQKKKQSGLEHA